MFKRIIKIILILLAIFLFILGVIWLIGRHKAKESGATPSSFKQFLGLSTKQNTAQNIAGAGTANFGNGNNGNNGSGDGSEGGNAYNNTTQVSQFTDGGTSPTNGAGVGNTGVGNGSGATGVGSTGNIGTGTGSGANGNGVTGVGTTGTLISDNRTAANGTSGDNTSGENAASTSIPTCGPGGTSSITLPPTCGTADTTITFSPAQITELNTLQNQFYAIAATLHTDADADAELANHDAFEIKAEQATELYNQCEAYLPGLTEPVMQEHAATPFWRQWNDAADSIDGADPNQWWNAEGVPQSTGPVEHDTLLYASNYNDASINSANLTQLANIHDSGNHNDGDSGDNSDTSGITGPYGLLSFSDPAVVAITGSVVENNNTTENTFFGIKVYNPFNLPTPALPKVVSYLPGFAGVGTKTVNTTADWVLLVPVVEKILQINLW